MAKAKSPSYRRCVGVALFNCAGLVFAGRRANKSLREHVAPGYEWQMPQGGIDKGEDPLTAALRELYEETNVTSVTLLGQSEGWFTYDLPSDIAREAWKGKYRGQKQKWFAFRFHGEDSEIDIHNPGGGHEPEFDAWRWERLDAMLELIIPFKRGVYERVVDAFGNYAKLD